MKEEDALSNAPVSSEPEVIETRVEVNAPEKQPRTKLILWSILSVFFVGVIGGAIFFISNYKKHSPTANSTTSTNIKTQKIGTETLSPLANSFTVKDNRVIINGEVNANQGLVLQPSSEPANPQTGQIYLDSTSKELKYYNGNSFITVADKDSLSKLIASIASASAGSTGGVDSLQGSTGAITLLGSGGLSISASGTNISLKLPQNLATTANPTFAGLTLGAPLAVASGGTGVSSFASNAVVITNNSGGLSSLTGAPGLCLITDLTGVPQFGSCSGAASIASLNGGTGILTIANASNPIGVNGTITIDNASTTAKGIAQFNATNFSVASGVVNTIQNIATSSSPTFAGLTLSSPLTVQNGGSGAVTLGANGVLIGHGTGAITSVVAGNINLCLVSTAGAPTWQSCPGAGGVSSVNGGTGAITINNATNPIGVNGAITINNAVADGATKGIAAFNSTNFTSTLGVINTIQGISTSATPQFAGLTLTNPLAVSSGGTGLNSTPANGKLLIGNGSGYSLNTLSTPNNSLTITNGVGTIGLDVIYGSIANTAVQGNKTIVCPTGTGNLSGGGNTITLGNGGTCNSLNTIASPTFTGLTISGFSAGVVQSDINGLLSSNAVDLSDSSLVTNILNVANGGTGASSLTLNGVLIGNGTSAITSVSTANVGWCLVTGIGGAPTWQSCPGSGGSGDNVQVNGTDVNSTVNILDTAATNSNVATTWTLSPGSPDQLTLTLGAASGTDAGIITAQNQTLGGNKTFTGNIILQGGGTLSAGSGSGLLTVPAEEGKLCSSDLSVPSNDACYSKFAPASGSSAYIEFAPTSVQQDHTCDGIDPCSTSTIYVGKTSNTGDILRIQGWCTDPTNCPTPQLQDSLVMHGNGDMFFQSLEQSNSAFRILGSSGENILNISTLPPSPAFGCTVDFENPQPPGLGGCGDNNYQNYLPFQQDPAESPATSVSLQVGTIFHAGNQSLKITNGVKSVGWGSAFDRHGVYLPYSLQYGQTYTMSFWTLRENSGPTSVVVWADYFRGTSPWAVGAERDNQCTTAFTVSKTKWKKYTCTFTVGASSSGAQSNADGLFFRIVNNTFPNSDPTLDGKSWYLDDIFMVKGASLSTYTNLTTLTSPLQVIPTEYDHALSVTDDAGDLFVVDSFNHQVTITRADSDSPQAIPALSVTNEHGPVAQFQSSTSSNTSPTLVLLRASGQTSKLLSLQDASGNEITGFNSNGQLVFHTSAGSAITGTLSVTGGGLTVSRNYILPNVSGTICVSGSACAGSGGSLQDAYNNSTGGSTPEIVLNSTQGSLDIQDNASSIGANLLNIWGSGVDITSGNPLFSVGTTGISTFRNSADTANAFTVQNAAGSALFNVNTLASQIEANGNVVLGATNNLYTNNILQTSGGNNITISAGNDTIGLTSSGINFSLPTGGAGSQTICTTVSCIALAPSGSQTDNSANASIFINDTGGGNLLSLQSGGVNAFTVNNSGVLTLGTPNSLPGVIKLSDGGSAYTATLQTSTLTTGNYTLSLPDTAGVNDTVCLKILGNCAGSGGGVTSTGGTTNKLAKFTGSHAIGDSNISDDGTTVNIQGSGGLSLGTSSSVNGKLVFDNLTNSNTITLQSPSGANAPGGNLTFTLPKVDGSSNQCLQTNGGGVLSFANCVGGSGGASGVVSVAGASGGGALTGALTLNNASGSGSTLTIDSALADGTTKGIATFNSSNFKVTSGAINTIQDIGLAANPQFASVLAPLFDSSSAGTLSVGTTTATAIHLDQTVTIAANKNLTFASGAGNFDQSNSSGTFDTGTGSVRLNGNTTVATNKSFTANGSATFADQTNATNAFQIQNATGTALLSADTTVSTNLVTNGNFEAGTSGWQPKGSATLTQSSSNQAEGNNSLSIATTAAANDGAKYNLTLSNSTTYTLSFWAKASSSALTSFNFGYAQDGSTETGSLASVNGALGTAWQRYGFSFTTGTVSGTPYLFFKQNDNVSRTIYLDGVQVETGSNASAFNQGGALQFLGIVNSPLNIKNKQDSTNAFMIQSAAGGSVFGVDTVDGTVWAGNNAFYNPLIALYDNQTYGSSTNCATFGCYGAESIVHFNNAGGATPLGVAVQGQFVNDAGTTTNAIIFQALNPTVTSGTITNDYGLFVQPMTAATNDYGIAVGAADTQTLWLSNNADNTSSAAGIAFGLSRDTVLYRSAANTLKTDNTFSVNGLTLTSTNVTAPTSGGLTVASGTASGAGTGGSLTLQGGAASGTTGSSSGALTVATQTGTSGSGGTAGGSSGSLAITVGNAGSASSGNTSGGLAGTLTVTLANGGNSTGTGTARAGGAYLLTGGTGGSAAGTSGNGLTAGAGAAVTLNSGAGGIHTATTNATNGGAGGLFTIQAGNGGISASTNASAQGGAGGGITLQAGAGGSNTNNGGAGSNANTAGSGGSISITAGTGGANNSTAGTGGTGADFTLTSGAGGAVTGASGVTFGGSAGTMRIQGGNGGNDASASGVGGNGGAIVIQGGAGGGGGLGTTSGGSVSITSGLGGLISADVTIATGNDFLSGNASFKTGTSTVNTGSSGNITIATGNATGSSSTSGSINIDVGTATGTIGTINLGTTNPTGGINIGNTSGTATINVGQSTAGQTINIGHATVATGNTQTIQIGDAATGTGKNIISVGTTNDGSTLTLQGGNTSSAVSIQTAASGTIGIGTANAANTIQVGNTTNAIAQTINIGNNATSSSTDTITIGNLLSTSNTTIQGGTGAGAIAIQAGSGGTISIGTANSVTTVIGRSGGTGTLTVNGNSTFNGTLSVNGHIISGNTSGSTTVTAQTAQCGTGCTASVSGNDTSGVITLNTGTGVTAGTEVTLNFANNYGSAPVVVITPKDVPASSTYPQYYYVFFGNFFCSILP